MHTRDDYRENENMYNLIVRKEGKRNVNAHNKNTPHNREVSLSSSYEYKLISVTSNEVRKQVYPYKVKSW